MRNVTLTTCSSVSVALMVCLSIAAMPVLGQPQRARNTVIGTWLVTVTRESAPQGEPLSVPALITFLPGRIVIEIEGASPYRSSGQGVWERSEGRKYEAFFRFLRFNQEGELVGTQRARLNIELDDTGNEFTATSLFEILDLDDHVVSTGTATVHGRRMRRALR